MQYRPSSYGALPLVIKNLIIINVLCFLVSHVLFPPLTKLFALHLWGARDFAPHQLVTHLFMHASLGHLFFNMFSLWMFGSVLEEIWGSKRFLTYYFLTGIGAALLYSATAYWEVYPILVQLDNFLAQPDAATLTSIWNSHDFDALGHCGYLPDPNICATFDNFQKNANLFIQNGDKTLISGLMSYIYDYKAYFLTLRTAVGASGAIYGLIMAYVFIAPNQTLYVYGLLPIKAKYFAIIIGLVALVMGVQDNSGDNTAHFAHLGGMVFGYIILKIWQKNNKLYR